MDDTEQIRRQQVAEINSQVQSDDKASERQRLEALHGRVWDTKQLGEDFDVIGFMAPYIVATEKATGKKGSLQFQHMPRFYFNWRED